MIETTLLDEENHEALNIEVLNISKSIKKQRERLEVTRKGIGSSVGSG